MKLDIGKLLFLFVIDSIEQNSFDVFYIVSVLCCFVFNDVANVIFILSFACYPLVNLALVNYLFFVFHSPKTLL